MLLARTGTFASKRDATQRAALVGGVVAGGVAETVIGTLATLIGGVGGGGVAETATVQSAALVGGAVVGGVAETELEQAAILIGGAVVGGVLEVPQLWTPAEITTALWLDSADAATLFDATTGGSLVGADGAIARWEDKSGNGRHMRQSTSGNRPIRKTAQVNGLEVVRFDGSNDSFALDSDLSITSHTIFIVFNPAATIAAASAFTCLMSGGTAGVGSAELLLSLGSVTGNLTDERISHLALQNVGQGVNVFGYAKTNADVSGVNNFALRWDNSAQTFGGWLNGNTDFATTSTVGGFTSTRKPNNIREIGRRASNNTAFYNGDILEIVVSTSALSTDDRQRLEGYAAHKWGTTSTLPGGHPYKSSPPLA